MTPEDTQTPEPAHGALSAEEPPERAGGGRNGAPKAKKVTQVVIERRVTAIFSSVIAGLQPWEIRRAVAEMQVRERREREKAYKAAVAQGAEHPDLEALHDVPFVWGDVEIPQRTFEHYLQKARALLDGQSTFFVKERSRALATQNARLNSLFARALRDGKLYAALKAVELHTDLFGLREFARSEAARQALQEGAGEGEDGESSDLSMPTDPTSRAQAFGALASAALAKDPSLALHLGALLDSAASPSRTIMP